MTRSVSLNNAVDLRRLRNKLAETPERFSSAPGVCRALRITCPAGSRALNPATSGAAR